MPEALWLPRDDARRLATGEVVELAGWPEGSGPGSGGPEWRVALTRLRGPDALPGVPGCERILVVTAGAGLALETVGGRTVQLRPLEPLVVRGDEPTTLRPTREPVEALEVHFRHDSTRAQVEVLRLGRRRAREAVGPGHALVHVLHGAASARLTGEEEPFELEAGESLWARELRGGEELDLAGEQEGTVVLLVRLAPATS